MSAICRSYQFNAPLIMNTILCEKEPGDFSAPAYQLGVINGQWQLELLSSASLSFQEVQSLRTPIDEACLRDTLEENAALQLANIGVTVVLEVEYQERTFALFSKRANQELAHICGYSPEEETFLETAKREILEEVVLRRGDSYLGALNHSFPYHTAKHYLDSWSFSLIPSTEVHDWLPSSSVLSNVSGINCPQLQLPDDGPVSLLLDPFSCSAQAVFCGKVSLHNIDEVSLLHAEESFSNSRLITTLGDPLYLLEVHEGNLTKQAFQLIDGEFTPVNLTGHIFHVGMSRAEEPGYYIDPAVRFEQLY